MNARIGKEKGVLTCLINILSRHENFNMTAIVFLHISAHYFFLVDDFVLAEKVLYVLRICLLDKAGNPSVVGLFIFHVTSSLSMLEK